MIHSARAYRKPFMPHWLLKSAIHRAISVLPCRQYWNGLFQHYVTRSTHLSAQAFATRLEQCQRHLSAWRAGHAAEVDFTVLEIGTGWHPIQPIGLALSGASRVWSFDIEPLLQRDQLLGIFDYFAEFARSGRLREILPGLRLEKLAALEQAHTLARTASPAKALAALGIEIVIGDAARSGLPAQSVDFFFSHSVFQYIPAEPLRALLAECRRVARPGAVHSHHILLLDQFHFFDPRIGPLNFYRYSPRAWRWLDSPLIPQTRLRISDYRAAFAASGWRIVREENLTASEAELDRVPLAAEFRRYTKEDLIVTNTWLAAETTD